MLKSWRQQIYQVKYKRAQVNHLRRRALSVRSIMKQQAADLFRDVETLFWISVAGVIFIDRRRHHDDFDEHSLFAQLGIAALAAFRWRTLSYRVARSVDNPDETESEAPPALTKGDETVSGENQLQPQPSVSA